MLDKAIKVLEKINENGFSAYIVGGFVRDYILGIDSNDIDICTNAKPAELLDIFENARIPKEDYGSVTLYYKDIRFEITTFRREIKYVNNRKPEKVEYINSLEEDILRRDFTINSLCMDKDKNIIDMLNGKDDINLKTVRVIGDAIGKFHDDALRILRAVRFATKLNFNLDNDLVLSIKKNKHLLKNISYERKKEELDKIFTNSNNKIGIDLLIKLDLLEVLEIPNLKKVKYRDSLLGIWAVLDVDNIYRFSNNEKDIMNRIRKAIDVDNMNAFSLYNLGLYANSVAASIKGIDSTIVTKKYNLLPIKKRRDINVNGLEIADVLNKKTGGYINNIYGDLEKEILKENLKNEKEELLKYVKDKYC